MAMENKFRLDLYHRLSIFVIEIPPLRDRVEDIPILLDYYMKFYAKQMDNKVNSFDPEVMEILTNYNYPGNIRELKNMVERAVILCDGPTLCLEHFRFSANGKQNTDDKMISSSTNEVDSFDLEENIKTLIIKALEKTNNNKSKAAELLNITWQALDRRIKKHGIE